MKFVCRAVVVLYAPACLLTLVLMVADRQHWFGIDLFLLPIFPALFLAFPWSMLAYDFLSHHTATIFFLFISLSMALNGTLLWLACWRVRRLFRRKPRT